MTRRRINLLCQVMVRCSNRWSHLVSSSHYPQSSSFCKIVQKWRKSISYNCLVAVSFEYKNYGSGYEKNLVEYLLRGFFFYQDFKFGHFWSRQSKRRPFFIYFNKVDTTFYIALTRQQVWIFGLHSRKFRRLITPLTAIAIYTELSVGLGLSGLKRYVFEILQIWIVVLYNTNLSFL